MWIHVPAGQNLLDPNPGFLFLGGDLHLVSAHRQVRSVFTLQILSFIMYFLVPVPETLWWLSYCLD